MKLLNFPKELYWKYEFDMFNYHFVDINEDCELIFYSQPKNIFLCEKDNFFFNCISLKNNTDSYETYCDTMDYKILKILKANCE